jgi:hypothetical protein
MSAAEAATAKPALNTALEIKVLAKLRIIDPLWCLRRPRFREGNSIEGTMRRRARKGARRLSVVFCESM